MRISNFVMLVLLSLTVGCGRKGNPKPPEASAPSPISYLAAKGTVGGIQLTWSVPETTAADRKLTDLAGFVIRRGEVQQGARPKYRVIAEIPYVDPNAAQAVGSKTKNEKSGPFAIGQKGTKELRTLNYQDTNVVVGHRYDYTVVGVNGSGTEGAVNRMVRVTFSGESSAVENIGAIR